MAYTPINWQTGDTITADKLNKMDNGWGVESTQLFSETVTTATDPEYPDDPPGAALTYASQIDAPTLFVTFGGTPYTCAATEDAGAFMYGGTFGESGPDFSNYPFIINSAVDAGSGNYILTETAGTYAVAVDTESVEMSSGFVSAVGAGIESNPNAVKTLAAEMMPLNCIPYSTSITDAQSAGNAGRLLFFYTQSNGLFFIAGLSGRDCVLSPASANVTAGFNNLGLFYYSES